MKLKLNPVVGAIAFVFLATAAARAESAMLAANGVFGSEVLGKASVSYAQQGGPGWNRGPGRGTTYGAPVRPVGPKPVVVTRQKRNNTGAAIGVGLLGLAAGAMIGSALSAPASPPPVAYGPAPVYRQPVYGRPAYGPPAYAPDGYVQTTYERPAYARPVYAPPRPRGDAVAYCMQRYQSYDPRTGTYTGFDGLPRACP